MVMSEPTAEQWERIEEMVARGSIGWHPTQQPSADLKAVLDYVDELQASLARLDVLAGLTPEQVAAIPRLVAWYRGTPASFAKHDHWVAEWRELDHIYKEVP